MFKLKNIIFIFTLFLSSCNIEPSLEARDCIVKHTESYVVAEYNAALKVTLPVTKYKTVCDIYSEYYPNPKYEKWCLKDKNSNKLQCSKFKGK